ncbi:MAG TPA: CoA transferase, partial [Solirubrobacteraceae bacterium]|nr:CoA transferase [Solirubrobacteraceae bacterium]
MQGDAPQPCALDGLRVVDFGQWLAGPLAAMLLADHGADVVRVDPPGGRRWDSPADAIVNRGKRSIVLDLRTSADRRVARELIARADVVVESFRPGVMDRLGLGPRAMTAADPRLVYCSIPGFAHDDPRAALAGWEEIVAAATGVYTPSDVPLADHAPTPGGGDRPAYSPVTLASNVGAFVAATSIGAALVARERDGLGQAVEVALHDAMFEVVTNPATLPDSGFPAADHPRSDVQRAALSGGGTYRCADGRWIDFWPTRGKFMPWFAAEAGIEDWADDGLLDRARIVASPELLVELRRRLAELFLTRPALEWEQVGGRAGVPLAMHRSLAEWVGHEHARASGAIVAVDDPELGRTWQPGVAVTMSRTPAAPSPRRPLDGDREAI